MGTHGCGSDLQYTRWQRTRALASICWQAREKRQRTAGEKSSWTYSCSSRGTPVSWTGAWAHSAVRPCSSDAQGASCRCMLKAKAISLWKKTTCLLQPLLGSEEFLRTPSKAQARIILQAKQFYASNHNCITRAAAAVCARLAHAIAVSYPKLEDPSSGLPHEQCV